MELEICAYEVGYPPMKLMPSIPSRDWMRQTPEGFARRCLPLSQANASGWVILNPVPFQATWNGGPTQPCIEIVSLDPPLPSPVTSLFGCGILTWHVPWVFRTPPGYNMLVRGPANLPKDGIASLEGLVESDNEIVTTFTMNWKFTRPGSVTFARGEPFCMLVPHARADLEQWKVTCLHAHADSELYQKYRAWSVSRDQFNTAKDRGDAEAVQQKWQKDYFQSAEQTKRRLACPVMNGEIIDN